MGKGTRKRIWVNIRCGALRRLLDPSLLLIRVRRDGGTFASAGLLFAQNVESECTYWLNIVLDRAPRLLLFLVFNNNRRTIISYSTRNERWDGGGRKSESRSPIGHF